MFTGDQKVGLGSLMLALILLAAMAGAGCATPGFVREQIAAERDARSALALSTSTAMAVLATGVEANQKAVSEVRMGVMNTSAAVQKLAANAGDVDWLKNWAGGVDGRLGSFDKTLATKASTAEVAKVKATANTAVAKATALTRRVGVMETTHNDHQSRKVVQLFFDTCKVDKEGKLTDEGTKILPATKSAIADHILPALKDGKVAAQISGFADSRDFLDKGKKLANSNELNSQCAQARADAVYLHLVGAKADGMDDVKVVSIGKTPRFGKHDADRSVVVELIKP